MEKRRVPGVSRFLTDERLFAKVSHLLSSALILPARNGLLAPFTSSDPTWANWVRIRLHVLPRRGNSWLSSIFPPRQEPTMHTAPRPRGANPTMILTRREMAAVLADLNRKSQRSPSTRLNLIVFRLSACCGLRASEIAQLATGRRPRRTGSTASADSRRGSERRQTANRSLVVGRRHAGGPRRLESRSPGGGRQARIRVHRLAASGPRTQAALPPHAPQTLPHRLQGAGRRTAAIAHHPPRTAHLSEPRPGWRQEPGGSPRRRGACEYYDHQRVFARGGG